jgi:DtxR family transcriptional regulator, Mn-dependent transcriptional regulator
MLSEGAEEILEALWLHLEDTKNKPLDIGASRDDPALEELIRLGLVKADSRHIYLLDKGRSFAAGCVRRHRLAERLLNDILKVRKKSIDEVSCKFEHLLHEGIEDRVCALLGHPKECPHGKPIPPGRCCSQKRDKGVFRFIAPVSDLDVKDKGRVVYLQAQDHSQMQKLISIGVLPGMPVQLIQKFPSYVISLEEAEFAIDKALASAIYVRLSK